jgi:hypothetical protein
MPRVVVGLAEAKKRFTQAAAIFYRMAMAMEVLGERNGWPGHVAGLVRPRL